MNEYPKTGQLEIDKITKKFIRNLITVVSIRDKKFVISPLLYKKSGFPISNQLDILNQKGKLKKSRKFY